MITIEMSGGLGNQMFQYALYLNFKNRNRKVRLDLSEYMGKAPFRKYELDVFGIKMDDLPQCDGESIVFKVLNKLSYSERLYDETEGDCVGTYQPQIFEIKEGSRIRGYWQNEKYFSDISQKIRRIFFFDEGLVDKANCDVKSDMEKCNSVSVHIRRGDYLEEKNQKVYGTICDVNYYRRAINYIRSNVESPQFYLFSDDIVWVKDNILEDGMEVIDWNLGEKSWQDMYLMSKCKHHIIANSTFSWWGAWLGDNADKVVVAPNKWFVNHNSIDTICEGWIRMQ